MGEIFGDAMRGFVTTIGASLLVLTGLLAGFVYVMFRA